MGQPGTDISLDRPSIVVGGGGGGVAVVVVIIINKTKLPSAPPCRPPSFKCSPLVIHFWPNSQPTSAPSSHNNGCDCVVTCK